MVHWGPLLRVPCWQPTFWNSQSHWNVQKNHKGLCFQISTNTLLHQWVRGTRFTQQNVFLSLSVLQTFLLRFYRWISSSLQMSQKGLETWSLSCSVTIQLIASLYKMSLIIHGCVLTLTECFPQPTQQKNEPTWHKLPSTNGSSLSSWRDAAPAFLLLLPWALNYQHIFLSNHLCVFTVFVVQCDVIINVSTFS